MRIISGEFGGRRLNPSINKWPTRPSTDFAKEAIFNILQHSVDFKTIKVLDLFGGTGSISLEFISRGCKDITYVENYKPAISFVKGIKQEWSLNGLKIIQKDVFKYIKSTEEQFDIIFADPPYDHKDILQLPLLIRDSAMLKDDGQLIIEHSEFTNYEHLGSFLKCRSYGGCYFSFFTS